MWLTEVGKRQACFPKKMMLSLSVILYVHHLISLGITVYESRTKSKLILKEAKWWLTEINLHILL